MDSTTRKRIGILLVSSDIGVVYYLLSIVKSLEFLNDLEKPAVVLLYDKDCEKFIDLFSYTYLSKHKVDYNKRKKLKYLQSILLRKNLFTQPLINKYKITGLFPSMDNPISSSGFDCTIASWIPDLQHKFYPAFFSKSNLLMREKRFQLILSNCNAVVLSSNDAHSHLKKFYKFNQEKSAVHVMPFVSMIQDFKITNFADLVKKHSVTHPYFLVSNQFYAHKNHIVVLNAIKILKEKGYIFTVFLTGKTEDYRNPLFYATLTDFIELNDLKDEARILGLIPREDQLGLLKNSLAIIQPSKFEGWSTIIEDAKTLNKQVICSNIDVHIEQMKENAFYFNVESADELSSLMERFLTNQIVLKPVLNNYAERVKEFATRFIHIFS